MLCIDDVGRTGQTVVDDACKLWWLAAIVMICLHALNAGACLACSGCSPAPSLRTLCIPQSTLSRVHAARTMLIHTSDRACFVMRVAHVFCLHGAMVVARFLCARHAPAHTGMHTTFSAPRPFSRSACGAAFMMTDAQDVSPSCVHRLCGWVHDIILPAVRICYFVCF